MDLPLWDLSDAQGCQPSFINDYNGRDVWECGDSGYVPDVMEQDALNEKSCVQVLRILINKADDEIVKLEEDIVMLCCQLAWENEDWSETCSAALREKTDHLDILIQCLKKDITDDDVHDFGVQLEQPEKVAQRLHDLVKPLLENYLLVKNRKQYHTDADVPAVGLGKKKLEERTSQHNRKVEEKERINRVKTYVGKNPARELVEIKIINRKPKSAPAKSGRRNSIKSEPSDPTVKASSASIFTEKDGSRVRDGRKNDDKKVMSKAKVTQDRAEHEGKVTNSHLESRVTEKKIAETIKPEGQGPLKKSKSAPEIVQNLRLEEKIDMVSSITENLKGKQKIEVLGKIIKDEKKETEQELSVTNLDGASEVDVTSISSPQRKKDLSFSSQTIMEEEGFINSVPCIEDVEKLTVKDLQTIAKNQKLTGYSKLRKDELRKHLRLEPLYLQEKGNEKKGTSPANTI